jgi:hypothetical protein
MSLYPVLHLPGNANRIQLRFIHESILQLLEEHNVGKILDDDTGLPTIRSEDRAWIAEN